MLSALSLARHSCRGSLLKVLQSQSPLLKSSTVIRNSVGNNTLKCTSFFNTSQSVLAAHTDHSHSQIWTAERFLSAGLIGIVPLALAFPSPALDYALALTLTVHVHWGVEAIVVDYVRPSIVGATLSRIGVSAVYALSVLTIGGLFYFNYTDIGLSQAIRMLWKL